MNGAFLPGLTSALFGLSVSAFALWLLAGAQIRVEALRRRIIGSGQGIPSDSRGCSAEEKRPAVRGWPLWLLGLWPAWLGGVLLGGPHIGIAIAASAVFGYATWLAVASRRRKRQLAIAVQSLVRDLYLLASSGDTAARCLRLAADRCAEPLRSLLRPALLGIQAGQGVRDAVMGIKALAPISEYMDLAQALWLHLETGASLSSLLAESAERADEAALLRSETDAKLTEARSTARVLALVPVAVAAYLCAFNREAIMPLVKDPAGKLALAAGLVLWLVGVAVVWRIQVPPSELAGET